MNGIKVTRLRVVNYRGIEAVDFAVGLHGAIVSGPNAAGKTSLLRAIRAALAGQDIGPDAIRLGEARSEILVDLSCASVRRVITSDDTTLEVKEGGKTVRSPQKWLKELLGTAALDPLDFFRGSPAERRKSLLAAIPAELDQNAAVAAIPPGFASEFPEVMRLVQAGGHALTVCAAVAKVFFDARTDTSRALKQHEADANAVLAKGPLAPPGKDPRPALEVERAALKELEGRAARASANAEARARTMARVKELRDAAQTAASPEAFAMAETRAKSHQEAHHLKTVELGEVRAELAAAEERHKAAIERVTQLTAELHRANNEEAQSALWRERVAARAERARTAAEENQRDWNDDLAHHERQKNEARMWLEQAHELEKTISALEQAPTVEEEATVRATITALERRAATFVEETARQVAFKDAQAATVSARKRAEELTKLVDVFRETLPKQVIAKESGIEGLSLDSDRILLDGVDVDGCSGKEQLQLAVEIARRANAKSRILVVDGLETLDPVQYESFVRHATRDDYQLIASRVDGGDLAFEAISLEEDGT